MLKNILWAVVLSSAILVMSARDEEQKREWQQLISLCNETGKHCLPTYKEKYNAK